MSRFNPVGLRIQAAAGIFTASAERIPSQIKFNPGSIEEAVMRMLHKHAYLSIAALFLAFSASAQEGGKNANSPNAKVVAQQPQTGGVRAGRGLRA